MMKAISIPMQAERTKQTSLLYPQSEVTVLYKFEAMRAVIWLALAAWLWKIS